MKSKVLNFLLILSSCLAYLEWGKGNSSFLFEAEMLILIKLFSDPVSVFHPLVLLPLAGQLLLLYTLFQKEPGKRMSLTGFWLLFVLMFFITVTGILALNLKIIISTIPFLTIGVFTINHYRKLKKS
ncbi:MAG TPA: hypothetical protein PKM97_05005 [Bacteroidia bacterium]|nr:hypothetical protein [Bacteroidia bacterium]